MVSPHGAQTQADLWELSHDLPERIVKLWELSHNLVQGFSHHPTKTIKDAALLLLGLFDNYGLTMVGEACPLTEVNGNKYSPIQIFALLYLMPPKSRGRLFVLADGIKWKEQTFICSFGGKVFIQLNQALQK